MRITKKILQKQLDQLNNTLGSSIVFIQGYDENFQKNIYGLNVHQGYGSSGRTADEMYAYLEGALDYSYLSIKKGK
jgi:predicted class III extradiol MEMO1 family dioxygenase